MAINFTSADIRYTLAHSRTVKAWLKALISEENKAMGSIAIVWCSDDYLLDVNRKYLSHDYFTDIITFDYSEGDLLSADLMISLDRVKANAAEYGGGEKMFHVEQLRVMAHGLLHLCGYKDKTTAEQKMMRAKEEYYLSKYEV